MTAKERRRKRKEETLQQMIHQPVSGALNSETAGNIHNTTATSVLAAGSVTTTKTGSTASTDDIYDSVMMAETAAQSEAAAGLKSDVGHTSGLTGSMVVGAALFARNERELKQIQANAAATVTSRLAATSAVVMKEDDIYGGIVDMEEPASEVVVAKPETENKTEIVKEAQRFSFSKNTRDGNTHTAATSGFVMGSKLIQRPAPASVAPSGASSLNSDNTANAWLGAGRAAANITSSSDPYADLLQPVNAILKAQAAKERAALEKKLKTENEEDDVVLKRTIMIEKDAKGNAKIHRDVFATTSASNPVDATKSIDFNGKAMERFGVKGSYNLFPENTYSYDVSNTVIQLIIKSDSRSASLFHFDFYLYYILTGCLLDASLTDTVCCCCVVDCFQRCMTAMEEMAMLLIMPTIPQKRRNEVIMETMVMMTMLVVVVVGDTRGANMERLPSGSRPTVGV
jgi:hypothetical protein